jgi:MOSC domain-containing protein YiiM
LRAVARDRQGCLGVYASTVEPGHVALNDPVTLESAV